MRRFAHRQADEFLWFLGQNYKLQRKFLLSNRSNSQSVGILLRQDSFFDLHRIKFEKDHDTFEITSVKK